jgi:membrane protein YqaA with SNARE-associated domain
MFSGLIVFWFELLSDWGYLGVVVLMAMESSIFPVPSELVIPPAIYWATQGQMSFGWFGPDSPLHDHLLGEVGRAVINATGNGCTSRRQASIAPSMVHRYEASGVFFQIVAVVRHVISYCGVIRMILIFRLVTTAGASPGVGYCQV